MERQHEGHFASLPIIQIISEVNHFSSPTQFFWLGHLEDHPRLEPIGSIGIKCHDLFLAKTQLHLKTKESLLWLNLIEIKSFVHHGGFFHHLLAGNNEAGSDREVLRKVRIKTIQLVDADPVKSGDAISGLFWLYLVDSRFDSWIVRFGLRDLFYRFWKSNRDLQSIALLQGFGVEFLIESFDVVHGDPITLSDAVKGLLSFHLMPFEGHGITPWFREYEHHILRDTPPGVGIQPVKAFDRNPVISGNAGNGLTSFDPVASVGLGPKRSRQHKQ